MRFTDGKISNSQREGMWFLEISVKTLENSVKKVKKINKNESVQSLTASTNNSREFTEMSLKSFTNF